MLIQCPACGEKVSDTAESCVHCGARIAKEKQKPTKFNDLPESEQEKLRAEFMETFPNHKKKFDKLQKIFKLVWGGIIILLVLMIAVTFPVGIKLGDTAAYTDLGVFGGLCFVYLVFMCICFPKLARASMVFEKRMQLWLQEEKGYTVDMVLSRKWKKIYDSIVDLAAEEKRYGLD